MQQWTQLGGISLSCKMLWLEMSLLYSYGEWNRREGKGKWGTTIQYCILVGKKLEEQLFFYSTPQQQSDIKGSTQSQIPARKC